MSRSCGNGMHILFTFYFSCQKSSSLLNCLPHWELFEKSLIIVDLYSFQPILDSLPHLSQTREGSIGMANEPVIVVEDRVFMKIVTFSFSVTARWTWKLFGTTARHTLNKCSVSYSQMQLLMVGSYYQVKLILLNNDMGQVYPFFIFEMLSVVNHVRAAPARLLGKVCTRSLFCRHIGPRLHYIF